MTTIVGYRGADCVWLAADSRFTSGNYLYPGTGRKIWMSGRWTVAASGGGRTTQTIARIDLADSSDAAGVGDRLFEALGAVGLVVPDKDHGRPGMDATVLASDGQSLYEISAGGTVIELMVGEFTGAGSGCEFAQGALAAMIDELAVCPEKTLRRSIEAAMRFDLGTGPPIIVVRCERGA